MIPQDNPLNTPKIPLEPLVIPQYPQEVPVGSNCHGSTCRSPIAVDPIAVVPIAVVSWGVSREPWSRPRALGRNWTHRHRNWKAARGTTAIETDGDFWKQASALMASEQLSSLEL